MQTIIQWSLRQQGWRALLIRAALLAGVWLVVAGVFASEFYFSANGMGIGITWWDAARSAFRDWAPWVVLSPVVVGLAGRFRLQRRVWRRSLLVHLAACGAVSLAYAGLLAMIDPYALTTGIAFTGSAATGETGGPGGEDADPRGGSPGGIAFRAHAAEDGLRLFTFANRWTKFLFMGTVKAQLTVPVYACIVCLCWMAASFREAARRESRTLELEALLVQSNLQALKMQLQPHFLFNTLNAISALVHESPRMADDMIGSLSQFLRATLELSAENEIPLSRELEVIDCYLEIQAVRFGGRLRVERRIDTALLGVLVPPLILQPLVENAVRYGIEPREAGGTVEIRAWREGGTLGLSISDNGPGFTEEVAAGGGAKAAGSGGGGGGGIGLANTRARLRALYGDGHRFRLGGPADPPGACVTMEIPLRYATTEEAVPGV